MTQMPAAPLFSIIVPTLNVAATLRACFDSIGSQSCRDFELLMIDGGSSDATLDIANSYVAAFDGRLVIHSESDEGAYDAMNNGVAKARGRGPSSWEATTPCTHRRPWPKSPIS